MQNKTCQVRYENERNIIKVNEVKFRAVELCNSFRLKKIVNCK